MRRLFDGDFPPRVHLEGATAAHLEAEGIRLLALVPPNSRHATFDVPPGRPVTASEQLIVVGTRTGLSRVVEGSLGS